MPDRFTQENRLISIKTPLGPDVLLLRTFVGSEGISRLFHFHLDFMSEDPEVDFDRIIGQSVDVRLRLADPSTERYFNGHISKFVQLPGEGRLARYQADMVPWLWFLTRTSDCRIFQNKSVPDIVQEVFQDFGFTDFENQLQGNYQPWEYCVQYRETAFNFVTRLLEQEGIFFFFRHEEGKHVLVLADAASAHRPCPNMPSARYERASGRGYGREEDFVLEWRAGQEMRPGKYALNDYNFETPSTSLLSNVDSQIDQGGNLRFEVFDYPGEYLRRDQGDALVRLRMEEQELPHAVVEGGSNCRAFASGFRFELTEHERPDQDGQYVLTSVSHSASSGSFFSDRAGEGGSYSNTFVCTPFSVRFRPPRGAPKPLVQGPQTAVVVGPSGEEIYTDSYGRVKVQFHWDRRGAYDEKSSCWVRVSHPWAGRNWGAISLPRIGQEVIVDFLEGDPDRPIITGRVYNAEHMPPYTLPGEQTKSTFKTNSSKGGRGFNELRFEDKKGSEEIFVHAEKNADVRIKNDRREWVGNDRHLFVQHDRREQVNGDSHSTLMGDRIEYLQGDHSLRIMGKEAVEIQGAHCLHVSGDVVRKCDKNVSWSISGGAFAVDALKVVLEGTEGLTIACGGSFITLNPGGVFISGPMVNINTGGAPLISMPASTFGPVDPEKPAIAGTAQPGGVDTSGATGSPPARAANAGNANSAGHQEVRR